MEVAAVTAVTVAAGSGVVVVGSVVVTVGATVGAMAAAATKWEDGEFSLSRRSTVYLVTVA